MAKEVLEMEVKTNIGKVAKDQAQWNKEIKKTKDNIEDVNEEGKEVVADMQILGLSINGLKGAWKAAASGAKFLFSSIKMGIASTGVGLIVLAFGALATWFAKTKKGAEFLSVAFKGIGAAVNVIIDRIAKFGGGIAKILSGNIMSGLSDMGNSFKGIGAEILNDTLLSMALEKSLQKLTDSQRLLNVETAQRRADIEELKLIAEDVTKSEEERLAAAEKAFGIETNLLERRIANAEEAVRVEELRLSTVLDPEADALDILAQKEVELANIRGESVTKQIELNNKINAIKQETINKNIEIAAQNAAEVKAAETLVRQLEMIRQKDQAGKDIRALKNETNDAKDAARLTGTAEEVAEKIRVIDLIYDEKYKDLIDKRFKFEVDGNKQYGVEVLKTDKEIAEAKKDMQFGMANQGLSILASAAGEGTALARAAAVAQATISGVQGVQNAFTSANANIGATAGSFGVYPVTMAALAGTFAAMNISKIASGGSPGGSPPPSPSTTGTTPAPQMMSGAFDISGGVAPEPLEAYVLTDKMTNSQNQLANIRRRATI